MNLPDPRILPLPNDQKRTQKLARNGNVVVPLDMPPSLHRAIRSLAELEGKSLRAKTLELLIRQMEHEFYEQGMDWESAVDRPSKSRVEAWEHDHGR